MGVTRAASRVLHAWLLAFVLPAGCASDETSALSLISEPCRLNSDCNAGLVCAYGVCHEECTTSKDCDGSGRCVMDQDRVHMCRPAESLACAFHSDCDTPLVCGVDGACRNQCSADRDCIHSQQCVSATCADIAELDDNGRLPQADTDPIGSKCVYSSQCPPSIEGLVLECKTGACRYACFEERDCGRYMRCTSPGPGEPGNCELIGTPGEMFCDPDDPVDATCACPAGTTVTAVCRANGSGYDCPCN